MPKMGVVELLLDYALEGNGDFAFDEEVCQLRAFARALGKRGVSVQVTFKGSGRGAWSEEVSEALGFCLQSGWLREARTNGVRRLEIASDEVEASLRAVVRRSDGFQQKVEEAYREAAATP